MRSAFEGKWRALPALRPRDRGRNMCSASVRIRDDGIAHELSVPRVALPYRSAATMAAIAAGRVIHMVNPRHYLECGGGSQRTEQGGKAIT
jgi:hypothetical protein